MLSSNHPILREGLRLRVQQEPDMSVVSEADNLSQILRDILACKPDVALIDLDLPRNTGVAVIKAIHSISPATSLIALETYPGEFNPSSPGPGEGPVLVVSKTSSCDAVILSIRQALIAYPQK